MTVWTRCLPSITRGGDVGGDYQVTESLEVRYFSEDAPHAVVTVWFYAESIDPDMENRALGSPPFALVRQTECVIGSDPDNPIETEEWSDAKYDTLMTNIWAEHELPRLVREATEKHTGADIDWDGHTSRLNH